jgi:hypothetical protein
MRPTIPVTNVAAPRRPGPSRLGYLAGEQIVLPGLRADARHDTSDRALVVAILRTSRPVEGRPKLEPVAEMNRPIIRVVDRLNRTNDQLLVATVTSMVMTMAASLPQMIKSSSFMVEIAFDASQASATTTSNPCFVGEPTGSSVEMSVTTAGRCPCRTAP